MVANCAKKIQRWGLANSLVPLVMGMGCCNRRFNSFWAQAFIQLEDTAIRSTTNLPATHANLLVLTSKINHAHLNRIIEIYLQMEDPKWIISVGDCICLEREKHGLLDKIGALSINEIKKYLPIDITIKGCPPSFSELQTAISELQRMIEDYNYRGL